jgi:hypothetical protein
MVFTFRQSCHVGQDSYRRLVSFEQAARLGTTMLVTRDSPSIQGDVPGPDPARAPPSKAVAGWGSLVGGSRRGFPLPAKVRHAERRCPHERRVPGPRLGHTQEKHALGWRSPTVRRSKVGPATSVASGADIPVCLGRPGGWPAGGWLGQGFHQRPDLGIGVASVTAQGTEVGQSALLGPATHRLGRHMKELGDLRCTEVPRLGWLWHRTLHSWRVSPIWRTTLSPSGATAIQRST